MIVLNISRLEFSFLSSLNLKTSKKTLTRIYIFKLRWHKFATFEIHV